MPEFISSGRVLSLALTMVLLEITALLALWALRGRTRMPPDVLANLCAAAGLLAAAESLLGRAPWPYAASALAAALISHLLALQLRWRATQPARTKMPTNNDIPPRRAMLRLLSLGAVAALAAGRAARTGAASALVPLTSADPTAQALGYTDDSGKVDAAVNPTHKPEQRCSSCMQYQGNVGDARGGCNIYAGKSVSANGWCKVWARKPGS